MRFRLFGAVKPRESPICEEDKNQQQQQHRDWINRKKGSLGNGIRPKVFFCECPNSKFFSRWHFGTCGLDVHPSTLKMPAMQQA